MAIIDLRGERGLGTLGQRLSRAKLEALKRVNDKAKRTALTILRALIYTTPVDTSNALSNWQISLRRPVERERLPHFPGEAGSTASQSSEAAYQLGASVLIARRLNQPIFISNFVDYIEIIDSRGSVKARVIAPGFINRAIALGINEFER